ncbi:MAG: hypothetical protein IT445_17640 [Phycisphaeraceae bacterium]|nr:hypothetical protein [Phycisphaeraceae bacterium]
MIARVAQIGLGLFFVVVLAVYSGPAFGAEGQEPVIPADEASPSQATAPAEQPPVFDQDQAIDRVSAASEADDQPLTAQAPASNPAVAPAVIPVASAPTEPVEVFASNDAPLPQGQTVNVSNFGQIDLHVKDLDLTKVLQLLSIQSEKNIIASRNVAGSVSADLYGVDFYDALDAILHPNGFGYEEQGQFIYVYTADELKTRQEAERQTVYKVYRLSYLAGADAATFVQPLLSANGSVAVSADAEEGFQPSLSEGGANSFAHSDTLLINDYPENVERIVDVLKQIDMRPKQVLIEATILQTNLTEANAFGVDFSIFADLDVLDFTTPLGAFDQFLNNTPQADSGQVIRSNPGNVANGPATIKLGVISDNAAVFIRALDQVTDTNVIARPRMLVLNRQKADLLIGEKLGYISTNASETSTTQTVEFLEVGTQLTVRPFIGEDDFIRMELRPSVSDGATQVVQNLVIPNTTTAELTTNVMLRSGQTAVLGGLFKEDNTVDKKQVPGVGDVPILKHAFRGQDDTVTRSEVIFLIKPTVMKDQYLAEIGDDAAEGIAQSRIGIREGLLPWSRTRMVTWQMRQAQEAMAAGDNDKAKWHADLALYLDPTVVEARQMRQDITGKAGYSQQFSILDDVVDQALKKQSEADASAAAAEPESTPATETEAEADTDTVSTTPSTEAQPQGDATPSSASASTTDNASEFSSENEDFFSDATATSDPSSESADDDVTTISEVIDAWTPDGGAGVSDSNESESADQVSEVETQQ